MFNAEEEIASIWLNRRFAYESNGGSAIIPVDRKPVGVIPPTGFDPEQKYPDVARELREISRDFRLIYDPYTKNEWDPPECGLHVYTIHEGCLVLEKSCMVHIGCNDCDLCHVDMGWPEGIPCSPNQAWNGRGIVAWIRAHDKARSGMDRDEHARHLFKQRTESNTRRKEAIEEESRQVCRDWWNEGTQMLSRHGGPNSRGKIRFRGSKSHLNKAPTPTRVPAGEPLIKIASG